MVSAIVSAHSLTSLKVRCNCSVLVSLIHNLDKNIDVTSFFVEINDTRGYPELIGLQV